MEMIIAMMISALLIGTTYTAYVIISRSYLSYTRKNKEMAMVIQLDRLLQKDFSKAIAITREEGNIRFKTDSITILYTFNPDFITRTQGIRDTFAVQTELLNTTFEGQQSNVQPTDDSESLLDDLELTILLQKQKIPYHYHKIYSSTDLFQLQTDAVH